MATELVKRKWASRDGPLKNALRSFAGSCTLMDTWTTTPHTIISARSCDQTGTPLSRAVLGHGSSP
jgi:hypothetical protein